jgi:chlorobactene glucosyltransferase
MLVLGIISIFTILLTIFLLHFRRVITYHAYDEPPVIENIEGKPPLVSIIVPMRNEEKNTRRCIGGLLSQNYPNFEIVAVDDWSKDSTLKILKELASRHNNLQIIEGNPVPEDWVGKSYALWRGVEQAKGDWLLFVDADTASPPYMLTSVINYVEENKIDMLSISPFQVLETFWERVIQPVVLSHIYYAFPYKKINDPKSKIAAANGQFILIRQSVYKPIGGHLAVKNRIVEDVALANLVKGRGYRLHFVRGKRLIKTWMYTNFGEIWEGWTKNLFFGLGRKWTRVIFSVVILLACGFIPPILFTWSAVQVFFQGAYTLPALLILAESTFLLVLIVYNFWRQGTKLFAIPGYYSFTVPLGILIYVAIILSSAYKVVSGMGVTWKERVYRL